MQAIIDTIAIHAHADDFHPIFEYEVYQLLVGVQKTAPGSYKLPYWFYKHCAAELANHCYCFTINSTLHYGAPPVA
jgi:hypothetical protein